MADPGQKTLKEATQDDPKKAVLGTKDEVLLQPSQAGPKQVLGPTSFLQFFARAGIQQGMRFTFLTEYTGAPIDVEVAKGTGTITLLTDSTLKISLAGTITIGDIVRTAAKVLGEDVDDPEYLRGNIGAYPGPVDADGLRPIRFNQSFEIVTRTQLRMITENDLPPNQIPGGRQDTSSLILDFQLDDSKRPSLELPRLREHREGDEGQRWFMRVWVDQEGSIIQEIGYQEMERHPKTGLWLVDKDRSIEVRTAIKRL